MTAPDIIHSLVDRFDTNRDQLVSPSYNETQIRREFIDPFFNALGWDIDNKQGTAEAYKDVVHEDAIKIGSATKAPDYSFRIGGTRKFFVEAKKPAVNIKDDVAPAFQLRRYAWSAKLPVSILTDFDELAVYDCRIKPSKTDKSSTARIKYLTYKDYISHWEEIHSIFSHDAVWKGSFDKYVVGTKGKKGTDEVDDAFLKEIESWREVLARNFALRNSKLTVRELNFAVQRTIDRIIFLRICEDRGIETYGTLQALVNGERIYKRLCELFQRADERYNSGLFHFAEERGRPESPDTFTLDLKIDDKPLKDIISGLYYPDCPYEFSILPADILGQVYEQFLGKVIRLTAGHQAKVEEKPEVKKAGGVYYTPTYIVDYIVKNTVGKLVEGKTPKQIAALRVLDPACGSGSFLIGAYQYILDWHHEWYTKDSPEHWSTGKNATLYAGSGGAWRLTTAERKRILLNNIYGVDIDSQAVEVTKLSLLLKVLEGENEQTINQQLKMFHERALPDLGSNIKCGNSLMGPDFFEGRLIVDRDERNRINAFDWKSEFKEIMDAGGFDAVIGNPPYIRMEEFKALKSYLIGHYKSHSERADFLFYFVERSIGLLSHAGRFGMILSNSFARSEAGEALRSVIASSTCIENIVEFGDFLPFSGATVYPLILIAAKGESTDGTVDFVEQSELPAVGSATWSVKMQLPRNDFGSGQWVFEEYSMSSLRKRILSQFPPLKEVYGEVRRGVVTGLNEAFIIDQSTRKVLLANDSAIESLIKPYIGGRDIDRYEYNWNSQWLLYIPHGMDVGKGSAVVKHLAAYRKELEGRATSQAWYELQQPQSAYVPLFEKAKIAFPDMSRYPKFCLDRQGMYFSNTVYFVSSESLYLLGLLNSKLLWFFVRGFANALRGGLWRFRLFSGHVERLPIRTIDYSQPEERKLENEFVGLVQSVIRLHGESSAAKTDQEKTALQRQIDDTDKQIDALVYELYGLTEEEIRIVEGNRV
jgi:hypothetical protein